MASRTAVLLLALVGVAAFVSTADAGELQISTSLPCVSLGSALPAGRPHPLTDAQPTALWPGGAVPGCGFQDLCP